MTVCEYPEVAIGSWGHAHLYPRIHIGQFYDPISWIPGVFPGEGAALPYDAAYKPKPAYGAIEAALQGASDGAAFQGKKGGNGKKKGGK